MAGVGIDSNRFYLPGQTCRFFQGTCLSAAITSWNMPALAFVTIFGTTRPTFIRPEIHYYHIQNNVEFHSDNVFRASVSVGYTLRM